MAGYKNFLYKSTSERETTGILKLLKEWGYKYNMELENDYSVYPYFILAKRDELDMLVFGSDHTVEQATNAIKKYYPDTDPKIYDMHTLQEFRVRVDLVTGPSYKPRKIERTLEAVEYKHFDYDEVIVEIRNPEELNKMFDLVGTVVDSITLLRSHIRFFPTYLLISPNETHADKKCVILIMNNHHRESVEQIISEDKKKYYPRILRLSDWGTLKSMIERGVDSPSYSPRKITRTLESVNYEEKFEIIIQFNNKRDIDLIVPILKDNNFFDRSLDSDLSDIKNFPSYMFLNLKDTESFVLDRRTDEPTDVFNGYTYKETYEIPYTAKDIMTLTKVLRTKKVIPTEQTPNYMPRRITRTLESVGNKVLYAFDLDDTLVFSKRFEDVIKSLLKESITPESILNNKMNEIGVERKDLKYEHGRIYFNDPIELFNVTGSQSWVRKDNRVYLLKPDEYLSTSESLPIKTNPVLVDIYNKAENKVIITSRKEKYRTQTIDALKKLGIEMPNYGLNMYPNNSSISSKVWKAMRLKELQRDCGFTEINYFDDNRIVLKKMREYLKRERIHVNFYKVKENDYRKYEGTKSYDVIQKYMKTNESVRDMMKPRPEEDIHRLMKDKSPDERLLFYSKMGHLVGVQQALKDGADVHTRNFNTVDSALRNACKIGNLEIVKLLVDLGSDIHLYNDTCLKNACQNGHLKVVKYLLDNGAEDYQGNYSWWAGQNGYPEIIKLINQYKNRRTKRINPKRK